MVNPLRRVGRRTRARIAGVVASCALLIALPAAAHLDLLSPTSRYGGAVLKFGPCGTPGGQRSANVTTLEPGAAVEVVWDEYIDHPGHYRIAFDADGDDDFVDPVCLSGCQTRTPEIDLYSNAAVLLDGIADTVGGEVRATVTLPDIECDNCTLQVIQVMYDKPPYALPGDDIYYQCADLVLREGGTGCAGDCDGDGVVHISELIRLVRIALGFEEVASCSVGDRDGDGVVRIAELIAAVQNSLTGCPVTDFTGFKPDDVVQLADDALDGRDNDTAGSRTAQQYIIDEIRDFARGLDETRSGDEAYMQAFTLGTNILAVIPGGDLADEYVIVGAHYDHFAGCSGVCNGATDNATGVAAVLAIGRGIAALPMPPRRSVILAFWDREEDGLLGSRYYVDNPIVPLGNTVAYLNFDIQGANLLPSLRDVSFAVGGESGGPILSEAVATAIQGVGLGTRPLSAIFGQGRSDYVNFVNARVPVVFFGDSTGPCYHTAGDEVSVVDFDKLAMQSEIGYRLALALTAADSAPTFTVAPLVVFDDAVHVLAVVDAAVTSDLARFTPADQAVLEQFQTDLSAIVAAGSENFGPAQIGTLLTGVVETIELLGNLPCDGFL
jgi:hypothetical protein